MKKTLFAILTALISGLALQGHAQEFSAKPDDTASAPTNQRHEVKDSTGSTVHPRKISEEDLKKKVTKINRASSFLGMKIKNLQNENLGKVEDLAFDPASSKISYAVLSIGGFLGMNEKFIAIPLDALTPAPGEDYLVLDADKERLERAPGFAKNKWPDLDSQPWGATSGFARRTPKPGVESPAPRPAPVSAPDTSAVGRPAPPSEQQGSRSAKSDSDQFSGKVTALDAARRTLTVKDSSGAEKTFELKPDAQVRTAGQTDAKLDDIKVGSDVSIEFTHVGDKCVAQSIDTHDSKPSDERE